MMASSPVIRNDPVTSSPRAAKRQRRHSSNDTTQRDESNSNNTDDNQTIPPEIWSGIMEYLPLDMILSCGAVSRTMLHNVMPRLTTLRIDRASQMNLEVAGRRFRDVTDIHINSLLKLHVIDPMDDFSEVIIDNESKIRIIPFLSRFVNLERVHFGGKNEAGEDIEGFDPVNAYFEEEVRDVPMRNVMLAFIDSISGAFATGAFSSKLKISGLCCPDSDDITGLESSCSTCIRATKHFPLESVMLFECRGSSSGNACSGRTFGLDVCLSQSQLESIVESRGGKASLLSTERLLRRLSNGFRYEIGGLSFVKYRKCQLEEIKRVIAYADLNVKELSAEVLHNAILRSFPKSTSVPPKSCRFLSHESLLGLRDEIGLPIDAEEINGSSSDLLGFVRPIIQLLEEFYNPEARHNRSEIGWDKEWIVIDCLNIVRSISEIGCTETNQILQTNGETVIPVLASVLLWDDPYDESMHDKRRIEATRILRNMFVHATETHQTMIINAGIVSKLSRMFLWRHNSKIDREALLSLGTILSDEMSEQVQEMIAEGVTPRIVQLLCSSDLDIIDASLRLLVIISKDHFDLILKAKVHEHLVRIVKMPLDNQKNILSNCSVLLRKLIEVDSSFVPLQVVYPEVVLRLVELLKRSNIDDTFHTNLAMFFIRISKEATEDNVASFEADFLSTLVKLQDSSVEAVSESAINCLEHISSLKSCYFVDSDKSLDWGEYHTVELVDSDEESCNSHEEAIEVSDDELKREVELAEATLKAWEAKPWFDDVKDDSPTLLGMPRKVMESILTYTDSDVNLLKDVCKRFYSITRSIAFKLIRKFQKRTENEISSFLCSNVGDDIVRCDEILLSLMQSLSAKLNSIGPPACFRLRGDTVEYLLELCQGYILKRLQDSLLLAIHSSRTEVQEHDWIMLPSQDVLPTCNASEKYHAKDGFTFECSCFLSSFSGIVWRWPENDCCDVLPAGAGRTIIRHLAYRAGIADITSGALKLVETELLHTLAVLLVEGYESSVEMAKHARYLEPDEPLSYGLCPSPTDMFYFPPPPLRTLIEDDIEETVYTIVPGQISLAAERRNIEPNKVYGCFLWEESEEVKEMSFYYKECLGPDPEAPCSDCSEENAVPNAVISGDATAEIITNNF